MEVILEVQEEKHEVHLAPLMDICHLQNAESFAIPLLFIDVTRATSTTLDVMFERRIEDYWNIQGDRDLSDSWTEYSRFTMLDEKPPDG